MPYGPRWSQAALFILNAIQKVCFTDEPIEQIAEEVDKNVSVIYGW